MWMGFIVFVLVMLFIDLGVFNKSNHTFTVKEALGWSAVWIALAGVFAGVIYCTRGFDDAMLFVTAYGLEKSLSIDNLFVFLLIFNYLKIPSMYQHKILFWGIIGALVMRALFIWAGIGLISRFEWIIYIFGAFLIYTGLKIVKDDEDSSMEGSKFYAFLINTGFFTEKIENDKFTLVKGGYRFYTPLLLCLILIEVSDVVFALDSIPAVIGLTQDPYLVFTSNVFAILGLRSLYFALSAVSEKLYYLKPGLSAILVFVGLKMCLSHYFEIPSWFTLSFIAITLSLCMSMSALKTAREAHE